MCLQDIEGIGVRRMHIACVGNLSLHIICVYIYIYREREREIHGTSYCLPISIPCPFPSLVAEAAMTGNERRTAIFDTSDAARLMPESEVTARKRLGSVRDALRAHASRRTLYVQSPYQDYPC